MTNAAIPCCIAAIGLCCRNSATAERSDSTETGSANRATVETNWETGSASETRVETNWGTGSVNEAGVETNWGTGSANSVRVETGLPGLL